MQVAQPSRTGLKPTIRQMMILVMWAALVSAGVRVLYSSHVIGFSIEFNCIMIPLLVSSIGLPLLVLLLRIFDTRGPVQDWYRAGCMAGGSLLSGLVFLLQDPACYVLIGKTSLTFPTAPLVAAVCLVTGAIQLRSLLPRQCAHCGRRDVITVARPARVGSRRLINTGNHGWCANCGATYERKGKEAWAPTASK